VIRLPITDFTFCSLIYTGSRQPLPIPTSSIFAKPRCNYTPKKLNFKQKFLQYRIILQRVLCDDKNLLTIMAKKLSFHKFLQKCTFSWIFSGIGKFLQPCNRSHRFKLPISTYLLDLIAYRTWYRYKIDNYKIDNFKIDNYKIDNYKIDKVQN